MQVVRKHFAGLGRASVIVVVVAAVFAGGLGLGVGVSPTGAQTGGEIRACVNNFTGALRIANGSGQCTTSERPLSWNQQGPGGLLDIQFVEGFEVVNTDDEDDSASVTVECPTGYRVIGGGAGLGFASGSDIWAMRRSAPVEAGSGVFDNDGWIGTFVTANGEDAVGQYGFTADAICVLTS